MKKKLVSALTLTLAVLALFAACGGGSASGDGLSGTLSLNGSTSVERVIAALGEQFMIDNSDVNVTFNPTGSGAGITSATEGTADIGLTSRDLRPEEVDGVHAFTFAIDGLAVIVHPDNPVSNLTIADLYGIYSGAITNWSEVGGNDHPITTIGREAGSGSRGAFDDIVSLDDPIHLQELTSGGAIITAVASNPYAIGYASLSAVNDSVRALAIEGVEITEATLIDGSYPVARPFIMLTQAGVAPSELAQAFMDFVMSPAATEIITNAGVVQVR